MEQDSSGRGVFFAPGHITGLFIIQDREGDILHQGSLGAGFSITRGVKTSAELRDGGSEDLIYINGVLRPDACVSKTVITLFRGECARRTSVWEKPLIVRHLIEVPLGSGFGTSGAGALSLAYALNSLADIGLSALDCAGLAHCAEVLNKTGLGTIAGAFASGFEMRLKPGAPGVGVTKNIEQDKPYAACFASLGPYSTRAALSDSKTRNSINRAGQLLLERLKASPSVENFLSCSREFAEETGLITPEVREILNAADAAGFTGSMHMFGNGVFTLVPRGEEGRILGIFKRFEDRATIFSAGIA